MVIYWVSAEVAEGDWTCLDRLEDDQPVPVCDIDKVLMLSFEFSGVEVPDNAYVMAYASFPDLTDEDTAGKYETVTCTTEYSKDAETANVYSVNNYYGESTFAVPARYIYDLSPIEINNQSWTSINTDIEDSTTGPWRADVDASQNSFASSFDEEEGSIIRCTAIRTISSNRDPNETTSYKMAFKTGTTYEVETGYKVWL